MRGNSLVPRGARYVLLASLVLNLFLAGLMVGRFVAPPPPGPPPSPDRFIDALTRGMSPADGAVMRQIFAAHRAELDQAMAQADQARESVRDALEAQTFDQAALDAALGRAEVARRSLENLRQGVMTEAVRQLSPEGRRYLAQMVPGRPPPSP